MIGLVNFGSIYTTFEKTQSEIGLDYKKIKTWTLNGPSNIHIIPDFENGTITINKTGTYVINASLSFRGTNERIYTVALFRNNTVSGPVTIKKYVGPNLKTNDMSALGIIEITEVPTVLDIRIKCDQFASNVLQMQAAQFTIFQIIATPMGNQ